MALNKEDKQIIKMLDKKTKQYILNLIREINDLYEVLSDLEKSVDGRDNRRRNLQNYEKLDMLEEELFNILNNYCKHHLREVKRERKSIYNKFNILSNSK